MLNFVDKSFSLSAESLFAQWLHRTIEPSGWNTKFQIRGNNLHILCEGDTCPDRQILLKKLVPALQKIDVNTLTPSDSPEIYQIQLYSCKTGHSHPAWTATIYLNQLDNHLEQLRSDEGKSEPQTVAVVQPRSAITVPEPLSAKAASAQSSERFALALSNRSLARQGHEMAIASYLSETLSDLGIALRVSVKSIPFNVNSSVYSTDTAIAAATTKRLWIACEALYNPDPSLVGETITQRLRNLEIEGYRDAVIRFQVAGEDQPDWLLRVDLTPAEEMLREWARWGDVEALQRLLNQTVAHLGVRFSTATLKEETLHLCCEVVPESPASADSQIPDQAQIKAEILPLLEMLGPQGIHSATLYGQKVGDASNDSPAWVEWLELPAAMHPALAAPALQLAQQQDWAAVAFLLHRLLNPSLDKYLATGGIRLQLLPKHDLLHVMSEAAVCPDQRNVGYTIAHFLEPLKLPDITGVRVYGRRAGQKHPLWSYGVDFIQRDRIVPEATPEFAASDAYVNELVSHASGESVLRPDLTPVDLQTAWANLQQRVTQGLQQVLLRSQLFISEGQNEASSLALPHQLSYRGTRVALVWGAVGVLMAVQANWLFDRLLRTNAPQPSTPEAVSTELAPAPNPSTSVVSSTTPIDETLPELTRSPETEGDSTFNTEGFTAPDAAEAPPEQVEPATEANLPYTRQDQAVNQALAVSLANDTSLPSFNSRQLGDKLKLYYRQLEASGTPDVLVLGSSRALRGVDPVALQEALAELGYQDVDIFNFGINGATAQVIDLLIRQILTPDQLPRLIIWADGARAFNSNGDDTTYNGIVASPAYQELAQGRLNLPTIEAAPAAANSGTESSGAKSSTDEGLNTTLTESYQALDRWLSDRLATASGTYEERDRLKHLIQQGLTALFPSSEDTPRLTPAQAADLTAELPSDYEFVDVQGFLSLGMQFNPATYYQKYARVSGDYDRDYMDFRISGVQEDALVNMLQYTQARQIPVVFVNLPMTDEYLDAARIEHEQAFRDFMVRLSLEQPGFTFRDLGERWTTQHDYFSDPSHLNRYGAYAVSNQLAQDPKVPWSVVKKPTQNYRSESN
ncbi:MAG: hypothetical protein Kow00121_39690 [Elainellaceae cyanobacterium]